MTKFQKPLRAALLLSALAIPAALAGCAANPNTKADLAQARDSNIPPYGPTRTIIAPDGSSFNCRIAGGAICPQP